MTTSIGPHSFSITGRVWPRGVLIGGGVLWAIADDCSHDFMIAQRSVKDYTRLQAKPISPVLSPEEPSLCGTVFVRPA